MLRFLVLSVAVLVCSTAAWAGGGLDAFLGTVNVQARADMNGFAVRVSAQFGVPEANVRVVLTNVREPADAFMVFQLSQWARQPSDAVMRVYQSGQGRGWGALAQELGIKPGSAEFHALKNGDLHFGGDPGAQPNPGQGKGKGKGKGKDKQSG